MRMLRNAHRSKSMARAPRRRRRRRQTRVASDERWTARGGKAEKRRCEKLPRVRRRLADEGKAGGPVPRRQRRAERLQLQDARKAARQLDGGRRLDVPSRPRRADRQPDPRRPGERPVLLEPRVLRHEAEHERGGDQPQRPRMTGEPRDPGTGAARGAAHRADSNRHATVCEPSSRCAIFCAAFAPRRSAGAEGGSFTAHSSRGPGHRPLTAGTGVQIPYALPTLADARPGQRIGAMVVALRRYAPRALWSESPGQPRTWRRSGAR